METLTIGIVVDRAGYRIETVAVNEGGIVQFYEMQPNHTLIMDDVDIAGAMYKPRWDGKCWTETASPKELQELQATMEIDADSCMPALAQMHPSEIDKIQNAINQIERHVGMIPTTWNTDVPTALSLESVAHT